MDDFEKKLELLKSIHRPNVVYYAILPLTDALLLLFVTFKLVKIGDVAEWNWIWVTSPFWLMLVYTGIKQYVGKVKRNLTIEKEINTIEDLKE